MTTKRDELLSIARTWRAIVKEIDANPRLSSQGKAEERAKTNRSYAEELRDEVAYGLKTHAAAEERTAAKLAQERAAVRDGWDWSRLLAMQAEAAAWARSVQSWDDAAAYVQAAIEDGDAHAVRALQAVAVPELRRHAHSDGPMRQNASRVVELDAALRDALLAMRPASLREAEAAHQRAVQEATDYRNGLRLVDAETAQALGEGLNAPGVLADLLSPTVGIFDNITITEVQHGI